MTQYLVALIPLLVIYGIIIKIIDSGRCFRYEFIVKTLIIIGLEIVCFLVILFQVPVFSLFSMLLLFVLVFYNLKFTIQRFYDLGLSGWYILLKLIPIVSIIVTIYLYFRKGTCEINNYDKAINYKKLFKGKECIDIFGNRFLVFNEEYQYERYLGKCKVKISKYCSNNLFTNYLLRNYPTEEVQIYKIVEIPENELATVFKNLDFIVIDESFYVNIKGNKLFIRHEDFRYTIILNKKENPLSKELIDLFDFPGSFYEDENNIYYKKIYKNELIQWVKNVA